MNGIRIMKTRRFPVVAVMMSLFVISGCSSYKGDTSGFKPEQKLTKDQINQQISEIQANKNMPEGVKQMAVKTLQQQSANAR